MSDPTQPVIIPRHVGLITDGNRRWAKERGFSSLEGHKKGFEAGKKIVEMAYDRGIKEFTAWAFSTENWNRSKEEIDYLMELYELWLTEFSRQFRGKDVRIRVVGQIWKVPQSLQKIIERVESETKDNSGMVFNMALSYGGRDEITQGIKRIIEKGFKSEEITERIISENIWLPDADVIIRTGGELRLSGFLTWQSVYSELFFIKKYLPDFTPQDFDAILQEYAQRQRRFGK